MGEAIGKCPECGGDVVDNVKSYSCANYKETGCKFAIWKNKFEKLGGKPITAEQARTVLAGKLIDLKGLVSAKTGKTFDTQGKLAKDATYGWGISFVFADRK